ncbi:MAG: ATP-binding cassette domain-containing protein [Bacteroidota bacterium]
MENAHYAILANNATHMEALAQQILEGTFSDTLPPTSKMGYIFSAKAIEQFLWEEAHHDILDIKAQYGQTLSSMSSGERKRVFLAYLLQKKIDFLILVNPFDHMDMAHRERFVAELTQLAKTATLIQIAQRTDNFLPVMTFFASVRQDKLSAFTDFSTFQKERASAGSQPQMGLPEPIRSMPFQGKELVVFDGVSVSYGEKKVLQDIKWRILKKQFWQLMGPNGSGKTTLLTMITGENPKGYGQNFTLFGQKKGSGESVWDLKSFMGYFTPAMVDQFRGYHSALHMILSGLHDSVGLYQTPSDAEIQSAEVWLNLIGLQHQSKVFFKDLGEGQKRLLLLARAMIKSPSLLILDEPTAGLDEESTALFIHIVNQIAAESNTSIVFVSHKMEKGLQPQFVFELTPSLNGSVGLAREHTL